MFPSQTNRLLTQAIHPRHHSLVDRVPAADIVAVGDATIYIYIYIYIYDLCTNLTTQNILEVNTIYIRVIYYINTWPKISHQYIMYFILNNTPSITDLLWTLTRQWTVCLQLMLLLWVRLPCIYIRFMHKPDHTKRSRCRHNLHTYNLLHKYMVENIT